MPGNVLTFEDPHAWLKAVQDAKVEPGAMIIPRDSVDGAILGFTEADTRGPTRRWLCPRALVRAATRGSQAPLRAFRGQLATFQGRRQLILDLRSGKVLLPKPVLIFSSEPQVIEPELEVKSEEVMSGTEIFRYVMGA